MSTKKLNDALGLGDGGIDEFLDDLNIDDIPNNTFANIDSKVKENIENIDSQIERYNENGVQNLDITNIETSLSEIKDLINISKQTIKHVYDSLVSNELVDPELVGSLSKLLEATHITISEYIDLYKNRLAFCDKVKLEMMKFMQKKELMEIKHKYDLEKINIQKVDKVVECENKEMVSYSQEDIISKLKEEDGDEEE